VRRIALSVTLVLVAAAAYLAGGIAHPTTTPVKPTTPEQPHSTTCPTAATTVTVAPALWQRRGDPCPNVIVTTTAGGDST
jgi:uncharacterized lipoprotein YajG